MSTVFSELSFQNHSELTDLIISGLPRLLDNPRPTLMSHLSRDLVGFYVYLCRF